MLEKTPESPLDHKEMKPVRRKGNQPWIVLGKTDAEAEAPILWPPDGKNPLPGKDCDAGKDWRQEKEDRGWDGWMASPHQWTWIWATPGDTEGPESLGMMQSTRLQRVRQDLATEQHETTPDPLCQDCLVNGCLEQGVGIEPYSVHSTHWPGIVVPAGIVHPSQGKEQVWTTGFLHLFQCFPCFALGTCLVKVSVLFYQHGIFCFLVGEVYLWVLFLMRVISMH